MEQMFFWAGALCAVLLGVIMYAFIMVIEYRTKFKMVNERLDFAIRHLEESSNSAWRMREDIVRQYNERMDVMERHAYEHMTKIETRIEALESKMIPSDAPKQVIKG
jgi:hypothetical protein